MNLQIFNNTSFHFCTIFFFCIVINTENINILQGYPNLEDHVLWIDAFTYTPLDENSIPTGENLPPIKPNLPSIILSLIGYIHHKQYHSLCIHW